MEFSKFSTDIFMIFPLFQVYFAETSYVKKYFDDVFQKSGETQKSSGHDTTSDRSSNAPRLLLPWKPGATERQKDLERLEAPGGGHGRVD